MARAVVGPGKRDPVGPTGLYAELPARARPFRVVLVDAIVVLSGATKAAVEPWSRLATAGVLFLLFFALPLWLLDPGLRRLERGRPALVPA